MVAWPPRMNPPQKIAIGGFVTILFGFLFGWIIFPFVLTGQINKIKGLARGSESRDFWEKLPFTMDFKVYVFNVTNYRAVQEVGDVPMLDEIGPYYFDETKEKVDIVDYEEDDSISFKMKNTYVLNKERSAPLTGRETIVIPHPLLMGVLGAAERDKPTVLGLINSAIPTLFNRPEHIFFIGTPLEFLFDGIILNCTSKDFFTVAVCTVLKKEVKDLMPTNATNIYKFSIFGLKNATADPNSFKISRGINNAQKVGEVMSLNGKKKLGYWKGRPCNDIQGSDGTVFPPSIRTDVPLWSYSIEICRSMPAIYRGPYVYKEIQSHYFTVGLGDMSEEASLKCFCPTPTTCLKKGTMDLMPCTGAPVVASLPHFYDSHEDYLKGVRGLRPSKEEHELKLVMEPRTGTPLVAKKRLMFSMPVHKIRQINLTQNLGDVLLPMFWVEEGVELSDEIVNKLDSELFRILRVVDIFRWFLLLCGSAVMVCSVALYYKKKNNALTVSPASQSRPRSDPPETFLVNKKLQRLELDTGHSNYGYIH